MKTKKKIKKVIKGALTAFALSLLLIAFTKAFADVSIPYPGIELDVCNVQDPFDDFNGRLSATLRHALWYANQADSTRQACRSNITIATDVVRLKTPLVIEVKNTGTTKPFVLEGKAPSGGRVLITAADLQKPTEIGKDGSWDDKASDGIPHSQRICTIIIRGTHDVTIKNIAIENSPVSGICFENGVNNVAIENVRLANLKGHGFIIKEGASENIIKSDSELSQIGGNGIHILSTNTSAHNKLDATSRSFTPAGQSTADGVASFATSTAPRNTSITTNFAMSAISGEYIHSEVKIGVRVDLITEDEIGSGKFRVEGAVVDVSGDKNVCQGSLYAKLDRLQVYAVGVSRPGVTGGQNAIFLTYVTNRESCAIVEGCPFGVEQRGDLNGTFKFVLDTKAFSHVPGEIREIILVPEISNLTVTSASKVLTLKAENVQDTDKCDGATPGQTSGGTTGSSAGATGAIRYGFPTREACLRYRNYIAAPNRTPPNYDSDGDGMRDLDEDLDGDCECDSQEYSCWDKPDSDGDGIPDPQEMLGGTINKARFNITTTPPQFNTNAVFCGSGRIPNSGRSPLFTTDLCDVDGDKSSNAREDLSDADSLRDYEEDRARIFVPGRDAHFYVWGGVGNLVPYRDKEGRHVDCTDVLIEAGKTEVGAKYGVFRIKNDFSGMPLEHDFVRAVASDEILMLLVCRNDSVRVETNFNGNYESTKGETHAYLADTNADQVNDDVCAGTVDSVSGECKLDCVDYEIFKELPAELVNSSRTALARDEQGVILYRKPWQQIAILCSDIDRDGIPDCVENETGQCIRTRVNGGQNLNPYTKDSDGDTLADGVVLLGQASDKCPFTDGETCDQKHVYVHRPVLAYFFDRDGDVLRDGEEDHTAPYGGEPDKKGGLDGRQTTETDPLSADTDEDGIPDRIEVQAWNRYTNPADADTDFDNLPDRLEVITDTETPNRAYSDQGGVRCTNFAKIPPATDIKTLGITNAAARLGTDPAKADTDGDDISDGIEVVGSENGDIANQLLSSFPVGGIDMVSNPLSKDSDGDTLNDYDEYGSDGFLNWGESNPCHQDTDGDIEVDTADGCNTSKDPRAQCKQKGTRPDQDGDGLSDDIEAQLHTGINDPDSDDDGLKDGEEDFDPPGGDGIINLSKGETDPTKDDTDIDGLRDGAEKLRLHTNPANPDTDQDCIPDGVEVNGNEFSSFTGTDTNPTNPDTDGDGLCDGNNSQTNGGPAGDVSCIRGEDMGGVPGAIACNGKVEMDPKNPSNFLETDPRNPDTDSDGELDKGEICAGGTCNVAANLGRATQGKSQGCLSVAGSSPTDPASMLYVFGLLALLNRLIAWKLKKKNPKFLILNF